MEQQKQRDLVAEVESFAMIFILVCFVSEVLQLLYRPFRRAGWRAAILGYLTITFLCIAGLLETLSLAYAKEAQEVATAVVAVPRANLREKPSATSRVLGQAAQGIVLQKAWYHWDKPEWVLTRIDNRPYYLHKSTLKITEKTLVFRVRQTDWLLAGAISSYVLGAIWAYREGKRRREAKLEYLGLSDRQLS